VAREVSVVAHDWTDRSSPSPTGEYLVGEAAWAGDGDGHAPLPSLDGVARPTSSSGAPKYAALLVHGMGQQTKFETLDMLVRGLRAVAGAAVVGTPQARFVAVGDERLHRLELTLEGEAGPRELHLYEAYWAPLTEGQITLRDVLRLVFGAIASGARNGTGDFRRWLFGRFEAFPPQVRTVAGLLVGFAAMVSLIVINATIALVAGTRWALGVRQTVVGEGLYDDLSTCLDALFVAIFVFALVLGAARLARAAPLLLRRLAGLASVAVFFVTLAVTIAVGLAIPFLFYMHRLAAPHDDLPLLPATFGLANVQGFDDGVELSVIALIVIVLAAMVLSFLLRIAAAWRRELRTRQPRAVVTALVLGLAAALAVGLVAESVWLGLTDWDIGVSGSTALARGAVWMLLVLASLVVRRVLVQFVGDVVAYVQPHTLDRFETLREDIKDEVCATARAVYGARDEHDDLAYAGVAMIGHSLGSVIAYDALNRLINDDQTARAGAPRRDLRVAERTFVFLTVGSPLDKTAFIFGSQGRPSEARSALAATVQPMIQDPGRRPARWINIHSPWDPISAPLDYYDPPRRPDGAPHPRAVVNRVDPGATTLFLAHLEYWEAPLVFETLLRELPAPGVRAWRGSDETSCPHPGWPAARGATGLART
jgi:hypothetical protein